MCLIIDRPTGVNVPDSLLSQGLKDNPDGWGIMRAKGGKLLIERGLDPGDFWPAYKRVGKQPCSIHFRLKTHGELDLDNCHPFPLYGGTYALMHNGIIAVPTIDKSRSDTWHFGHYVLEPMLAARPELFGTDELSRILGAMVGAGNKLVILRSDGASMIVNRGSGTDHQGLWISNEYSLPGKSRWATYASWPDGAKTWTRSRGRDYAAPSADDWDRWETDDRFSELGSDDGGLQEITGDDANVAIDGIPDQPWTLWDLDGCDRETIRSYLIDYPDEMTDLIVDALR